MRAGTWHKGLGMAKHAWRIRLLVALLTGKEPEPQLWALACKPHRFNGITLCAVRKTSDCDRPPDAPRCGTRFIRNRSAHHSGQSLSGCHAGR